VSYLELPKLLSVDIGRVFKDQDTGKILIVDDERFNCDIIEGFLMVLGMNNYIQRIEACYNGEQAVKAI
jgi:CheY-like chemotaxis protein